MFVLSNAANKRIILTSEYSRWTYKKLDYVHRPLLAEPVPAAFARHGKDAWLERDESGVRLRYVDAPLYGE